MRCICCCKEITDFPDKWKFVLIAIKTKEELREKLQDSKVFDWSREIILLTESIGNLINGLPPDIKDQYLRIRLRDQYKDKWIEAILNGGDSNFWLLKYKGVFDCKGGECECRTHDNG